jgi:hypothetical protein
MNTAFWVSVLGTFGGLSFAGMCWAMMQWRKALWDCERLNAENAALLTGNRQLVNLCLDTGRVLRERTKEFATFKAQLQKSS